MRLKIELFVLFLFIILIIGCSAQTSPGVDNYIQKGKLVEDSKASKWLSTEKNQVISGIIDEITGQYHENVQKISLLKLDDQYYIVEFVWENEQHWMHGQFYLLDVLETGYTQLPFGGSSTVMFQVISFKESVLTVLLKTGFNSNVRSFPYLLTFNVLTNKFATEPYFAELNEKYTLGTAHKLGFSNILIHEDGKIVFCFQETDGTELVGGLHTPTIQTATYEKDQKKLFSIDISDVYEQGDTLKLVQALQQNKYIDNAYVENYVDAMGKNHVVVFFELRGATSYNCGFVEQETAISDFYVVFN